MTVEAVRFGRVGTPDNLGSCSSCGYPGVDLDGHYVDESAVVAVLNIGDMHPRLCGRCLDKLAIVARNAIYRVVEEGSKRS